MSDPLIANEESGTCEEHGSAVCEICAVEKEREMCAKIADLLRRRLPRHTFETDRGKGYMRACIEIAEGIRRRNE